MSYYCLATVSECPIHLHMTGNELLRRLRRLGSRGGVVVPFDEERGKGSHGTLYFGERFTVLKDRRAEIRPGLLHAMLRQLGLSFLCGEEGGAGTWRQWVQYGPEDCEVLRVA